VSAGVATIISITEVNLQAAVERALAAAPPLTDEQRQRIADLLRTGHQDADAAGGAR
jgi:hypothetical protein